MERNGKLTITLAILGLFAHVLFLAAIVTRSIPAHLDAFALDHRAGATYIVLGSIIATQVLCIAPLFATRGRCRYVLGLILGIFYLTVVAGTPFWTSIGRFDAADDTSYLAWTHAIGYELTAMVSKEANPGWTADNHHTWGTGIMLSPAMLLTRLINTTASGFNNTGFSLISTLSFLWVVLSVWMFFLTYKKFMKASLAALMAFMTLAGTSMIKWTYVRNIFSHSVEAAVLSVAGYACATRYRDQDGRLRWQLIIMAALILLVQIRREDILFFVIPAWLGLLSVERPWGFRRLITPLIVPMLGGAIAISILVLSNRFTAARDFASSPSLKDFKSLPEWASSMKAALFPVLLDIESGLFSPRNVVSYFSVGFLLSSRALLKTCAPFVFVAAASILMCLVHNYPTGCEWQNRFLLKLNGPIFLAAGMFVDSKSPKIQRVAWGLLLGSIGWQLVQYRSNTAKDFIYYYEVFADKYLLQPLAYNDLGHVFLYLPLMLGTAAAMTAIAVAGWQRPKNT